MIAIAGAKGGCGKTTTTLALAEAFGRAGTPALAADADRQLPNLHVRSGIDREPTLAAVRGEDDVLQVAQKDPRSSNVGLLPAPKSADQLETVSPASGADVEHYLSVPKHRADCGFSETIELRFDGTPNAITVPADGELEAGSAPGVTGEGPSDE